MDMKTITEGALGRVFTATGAASGVAVADHTTIIQGALVALAGVAIDLVVRYLRDRMRGQ